ncbi:MAG: hypothetical protein DMG67_07765 [Acidobacteria bacterium]|nr:MAG: hypothetical protein DMG67_07765 [Acidobacteriota bacterium]
MSSIGMYLYGFTTAECSPGEGLRGLADAPVRLVTFGDLAAVVSDHPVQKFTPTRSNLEPHHRVVREVCGRHVLIPAAFGHLSETEEQLLDVLRENCSAIRAELERLTGKVELGLKLRWNVENIFAYLVLCDNQLREARDRVFRKSQASFDEKIAVGSLFEARLSSERNRLSDILWSGLDQAIYDKRVNPPRDEKTVCNAALLIERRRSIEFAQALEETAGFFDSSFALEYNGPWPPYSFVNLRLHHAAHAQNA